MSNNRAFGFEMTEELPFVPYYVHALSFSFIYCVLQCHFSCGCMGESFSICAHFAILVFPKQRNRVLSSLD
jgi:hypothetical protein